MEKEYIIEGFDLSNYGYTDINSYSVRYKVEDASDFIATFNKSDSNKWYVMGIDVAEEPESVKVQKRRDKKIDTILN